MNKPVLVLGNGQLGLMLAEAGARLGIPVDCMSPENDTLQPGASDYALPLDTAACLDRYPVITVEREHLPDSENILAFLNSPAMFGRRAMDLLPDRRFQKAFLDEIGVATAPWRAFDTRADLEAALTDFDGDAVVKSRRGGYDGKGLWLVDRADDPGLPDLAGDAIVERKMPFTRELSVVGARGRDGEIVCYPLTRNIHRDGVLRLSLAPASDDSGLQSNAEALFRAIVEGLDYRGVLAVELFEVGGELFVNELAPRVHNSGHWTQEGADISQFELHLRAVCGLPLSTPVVNRPAAMVNLLGHAFDEQWLALPGKLHWYGKDPRPGRKLGHINVTAGDRAGLFRKLDQVRAVLNEPELATDLEALERD
jgi:5-(carboxyamino)imidazole ribonucleotide synthase